MTFNRKRPHTHTHMLRPTEHTHTHTHIRTKIPQMTPTRNEKEKTREEMTGVQGFALPRQQRICFPGRHSTRNEEEKRKKKGRVSRGSRCLVNKGSASPENIPQGTRESTGFTLKSIGTNEKAKTLLETKPWEHTKKHWLYDEQKT